LLAEEVHASLLPASAERKTGGDMRLAPAAAEAREELKSPTGDVT
jgi:hypothetical protein